jgi:hypothetical protein
VQLTAVSPSNAKVDSATKAESRLRFKKAKRDTAINGGSEVAAKRRSDVASSPKRQSVTVGDGEATIASSNSNLSGNGSVKSEGNGSSGETLSSRTNLVPTDVSATSEMFAY